MEKQLFVHFLKFELMCVRLLHGLPKVKRLGHEMDHHHTTSEYYTEVSLAVNPSLTIDDVLECNGI